MSQVMYSTQISDRIYNAWNHYTNGKHANQVKKNAAFLAFCNACEREHKEPMNVVDQLTKH